MAGERWKKMSSDEKQPYLKAAMDIRNKKQNQQKTENTYKIENINIEQPKNDDSQKQEKPGKKEKKKKVNILFKIIFLVFPNKISKFTYMYLLILL